MVQVHEALETDDGTRIMVREPLEGETLGQRLSREHQLSLPVAAAVLLPVISATAEAHERGIVHRAPKPDTIFSALGTAIGVGLVGAAAATDALTRPDSERPAVKGGGLGWKLELWSTI